jgi:starch synthase (maltosyl-transferring)
MEASGRARVVIENISPAVDCGRFAVKRVIDDIVAVEADIYAEGHDELDAVILFRPIGSGDWHEAPMEPVVNDRWRGSFQVEQLGTYVYVVRAWTDSFKSWQAKLSKRVEARQDTSVDLLIGADLLEKASQRAPTADALQLSSAADTLRERGRDRGPAEALALDQHVLALACRYADRADATTSSPEIRVTVDRRKARFSSWYEMFPRSCSPTPGQHGTFRDCEARLPYIAGMGFDVLYFPPIHPIGVTARKGRNNAVRCGAGAPGTPWAIGSREGGHKSINPSLGTLDDFHSLVERAAEYGIEIALDIAFQCSPDHPYVKDHPDWFRWRPDGTVQYAENPPKKYQDIYPLEFANPDWQALWQELRSVVQFWIDQGVRIFRVDNPHTKPFAFWEWLISSLKENHPDLIFLAEAFTRPKIMHRLAKLGFTQSYTYFTWRRTKWELIEYITEMTTTEVSDSFRPSFWPNTPDILMDYLQQGGRPAFMSRLVLAATLSSNYGIYGPAFELCVNTPREEGSEEYLNSEKYELKHWDLDSPASISDLITRVNRIRHSQPALQQTNNICVQPVDNEMLLAYSKTETASSDRILVVVNMDPKQTQSGWVTIDMESLGLAPDATYTVRDLLDGQAYAWHGPRNYVVLDPTVRPAHVLSIEPLPTGVSTSGRDP